MYIHVKTVANISVRVDNNLKKEMERLKEINWSEIIREAIRTRIDQENQRNLAKAVLINEQIRKYASKGYDSTQIIRQWRETRH